MERVNPKFYPPEWFEAQVHYADRISTITDISFEEALVATGGIHTVLENGVAGHPTVVEFLHGPRHKAALDNLAQSLYASFAAQPDSDFVNQYPFGALKYEYNPGQNYIKIHAQNPERGTNPFAPERLAERRAEFRALLLDVQHTHPQTASVVSATWLRSTTGYTRLFPPGLKPAQDLMQPGMSFGLNYVWGQMVNQYGNVHPQRYHAFRHNLSQARTEIQVLGAFPLKALRVEDPIDLYYRYFLDYPQ